MRPSEKAVRVLEYLLSVDRLVSVNQIGERLGMSARSVRGYLKEVSAIVSSVGGVLTSKPGVGVSLEGDEPTRRRLAEMLDAATIRLDSDKQQRNYMLDVLLRDTGTYTMALFAEDLQASRGSVGRGLELAAEWLSRFSLELSRRPGSGLSVHGDEMLLRQAIAYFGRHVDAPWRPSVPVPEPPAGFSAVVVRRLATQYPHVRIAALAKAIAATERELGFDWTPESRDILLSQLVALCHRRGVGRSPAAVEEPLVDADATRLAEALVSHLRVLRTGCPVDGELRYLAVCIAAAERASLTLRRPTPEMWDEFAFDLLEIIGAVMGGDLASDPNLRSLVAATMPAMVLRLRYRMVLENDLAEQLKKRQSSLFAACWATTPLFERSFRVTLVEGEVANLALLINIERHRAHRSVRTVVVCSSGVGVSGYIAAVLEDHFPEIDVVGISPHAEAARWEADDTIDLVVYSDALPDAVAGLRISRRVTDEDLTAVGEQIARIRRTRGSERAGPVPTLRTVIDPDLVALDVVAHTKKEAIAAGCGLLERAGRVGGGFLDAVLAREAMSSTAIGRGIAIPHMTRDSDQVITPGIGVVRLRHPVPWSDEDDDQVDLMFVLALRFDDGAGIRDFFRDLYQRLRSPEFLDRMRRVPTPRGLAAIMTDDAGDLTGTASR